MPKSKKKRKTSRSSRALAVFIAVLFIAAVVCGYIFWKKGYLDGYFDFGAENDSSRPGNSADIITDELSIHFLELGECVRGRLHVD